MESLTPSLSSSEHWLTIMTCTICESSPESPPLYRCSMGHVICSHCFDNLLQQGGVLRCRKCNSKKFKQCIVSQDFLQKLKIKPGIGRRRRYRMIDLKRSFVEVSDFLFDEQPEKEDITVEKLFQLTTKQVSQLFQKTAKERSKNRIEQSFYYERGDIGTVQNLIENVKVLGSPKIETVSLFSRKPLTCPHYDCKKLITFSTFSDHFQHDHSDIPFFIVERGKTVHLLHDARMIEFNTTFCLAVLKICENPEDNDHENKENIIPIGTFWFLLSGSVEEDKNKSYVLYWITTDMEEQFKCTIEMSSLKENYSSSTLCAVNSISDSYKVADVAYRLNCLNLCYFSVRNLLREGCKLHLRVTIY